MGTNNNDTVAVVMDFQYGTLGERYRYHEGIPLKSQPTLGMTQDGLTRCLQATAHAVETLRGMNVPIIWATVLGGPEKMAVLREPTQDPALANKPRSAAQLELMQFFATGQPVNQARHDQGVGMFMDFLQAFGPREGEAVYQKNAFSMFADGPEMETYLARIGAKKIVLFGGTAENCVITSAIDGAKKGFKVKIASDLMISDANPNFDRTPAEYETYLTALRDEASLTLMAGESQRVHDNVTPQSFQTIVKAMGYKAPSASRELQGELLAHLSAVDLAARETTTPVTQQVTLNRLAERASTSMSGPEITYARGLIGESNLRAFEMPKPLTSGQIHSLTFAMGVVPGTITPIPGRYVPTPMPTVSPAVIQAASPSPQQTVPE